MESNQSCISEDGSYDEQTNTNSSTPSWMIIRFQGPPYTDSTPSERFWSQTISHSLERRMNKHVYKSGKRCLVENTLDDGSLQYVHCLSRRLDSRRINDLEFSWGMKRGTLNLDTRSNVFCVSTKFKRLWEKSKWILIPEDHILEHYYTEAKNGQKFPDIGEGPYKYRFFGQSDMKSVAIHRQIKFPDKKTDHLQAEHFMFSSFPFKNLGTLTSHIHPKFVLCHIGARSTAMAGNLLIQYSTADQSLLDLITRCQRVVSQWSPWVDDVASNDSGFIESQIDSNDILSETSDKTANCRLYPFMNNNRLTRKEGYVYVKGKNGVKVKHKDDDVPYLFTAKKLGIFEEQMKPCRQSGSAKRKWEAIDCWRSTISVDPPEQKYSWRATNYEHIKL
ncbi:hypothetical protein Clacol_006087 [Clathrus columnatus]|uniref:Uncharacterized protein n=1 Tax=Clathrus columnatus TaxID=1419009 RepID=A0AAV5AB51_9AGAM|nr:hypothetical protein Clacol_006087 [Clathrus columnatus]